MAKISSTDLLDAFKEMTLLELSDFVKQFEETFDVTAAAPVAVAAAPAAGGGGGGDEAAAEQDRDLPRRQGEGDVAPDVLAAERLRQVLDLDRDAHDCLPSAPAALPVPRPVALTSPGSLRRRERARIRTPTSRFY